ncbi:uncharacterized protein [Amphiura filiformis]|uniref:uncharacterized protein n=1 Tax=Amphiura filiformis TaxID=82378 RepID=UPI003B20E328
MLELRDVQKDNTTTNHSKQIKQEENDKISNDEICEKINESKSIDNIKDSGEDTLKQEESCSDLFSKQSQEEEDNTNCGEEYNFEFVSKRRRPTRQTRNRDDVGYVYREDTLRRRRRQTSAMVRPNACRYRQDRNGNVRFFMLYERPPGQERTSVRNEVRANQGRRMPSRAELARRQKLIYRVARVIGTLTMLGITVLIVNVPSTNRNFQTSPKIAPYRHEQPTYEQDGSQMQDTNRVSETERKTDSSVLYDSSTISVPTTEETTPVLTTHETCCMPKCDIISRKSGMCDCLNWESDER